MSIPILCHGCGAAAAVTKVTSGLRCACGSSDLDLAERPAPQPGLTSFAMFMTGRPHGESQFGTSEYAGPRPGPNPMQVGRDPGGRPCPVCHGSGYDMQEGGTCRECGGSGKVTSTSTPEQTAVAPHADMTNTTKVPFLGQRREAKSESPAPPLRLLAECPTCHAPQTELKADYKGEGWWRCAKCGPLANIDRHPEVNPYAPAQNFAPSPKSYRESKRLKLGKVEQTGVLLSMVAAVMENNPGLSERETLSLARRSIQTYLHRGREPQ